MWEEGWNEDPERDLHIWRGGDLEKKLGQDRRKTEEKKQRWGPNGKRVEQEEVPNGESWEGRQGPNDKEVVEKRTTHFCLFFGFLGGLLERLGAAMMMGGAHHCREQLRA